MYDDEREKERPDESFSTSGGGGRLIELLICLAIVGLLTVLLLKSALFKWFSTWF